MILYLKFIKEYLVINFDTKLKWKLKIISILLRNVFKYSIHLPLDVPFSTCSSSMSSMYILSLFLCEPFSFSLPFNSFLRRCGCIFCLLLQFFVLLDGAYIYGGAVYSPRILPSLLVTLMKEDSDYCFFYFLYLLLYKICILHTFEYSI